MDGLNIILSIKTFLLCCFYYSQQDVFNSVSFVFIVVYLILLSYFYLFVVFNFIFRCCDGYYSNKGVSHIHSPFTAVCEWCYRWIHVVHWVSTRPL